jgi:hypothetical protein
MLFFKLNRFICNYLPIFPNHWVYTWLQKKKRNFSLWRRPMWMKCLFVPPLDLCREYSISSSKVIGNFLEVLNFNRLFLKLNRFICNYLPILPDHWVYTWLQKKERNFNLWRRPTWMKCLFVPPLDLCRECVYTWLHCLYGSLLSYLGGIDENYTIS